MRLFYSPGAVSLVSLIALEEAGADYEAVRTALGEGANLRPEYLAINPRGLIPALEVDGRTVAETPAILMLIGRLHPESGLLPEDSFAAARVLELLSFFASSVHPGFARLFRAARSGWAPDLPPAMVADDRAILERFFGDIDRLLAGDDWLLGDRFTLADGYPLVFRRWARRQGFDLAPYSNWAAHAARILARPAVQRAIAVEGLYPSEF